MKHSVSEIYNVEILTAIFKHYASLTWTQKPAIPLQPDLDDSETSWHPAVLGS
jgi:hypothetical protein